MKGANFKMNLFGNLKPGVGLMSLAVHPLHWALFKKPSIEASEGEISAIFEYLHETTKETNPFTLEIKDGRWSSQPEGKPI